MKQIEWAVREKKCKKDKSYSHAFLAMFGLFSKMKLNTGKLLNLNLQTKKFHEALDERSV